MDDFRIPIGEWVAEGITWVKDNLEWLLDLISFLVRWAVDTLTDVLVATPVPVAILVAALLGWLVRSWKLALGGAIGFIVILGMDQWETSMQTLGLVIVAAIVAIAISIPVGIWSARNAAVRAIVRPILDFMQTMPGFVYLVPAIIFFGIGVVPGLVATVIFALPPGVRLTELGIRGVDSETVEAGYAFGAKPGQILRGIQLPLATPTIMAGVNQVILLSLSMVVMAGFVGADGLGKEVVSALQTVNVAKGVEAGLAVVIIAVYLDRLTAALGNPAEHPSSLLGIWSRRRNAARSAAIAASVTPAADREAVATHT